LIPENIFFSHPGLDLGSRFRILLRTRIADIHLDSVTTLLQEGRELRTAFRKAEL